VLVTGASAGSAGRWSWRVTPVILDMTDAAQIQAEPAQYLSSTVTPPI
jgi:hypothetical protein